MTATKHNKKVEIFEQAGHYLTAFVILMKGLDKLDNPEKTGYAIIFISIAVLITLGTIFHHRFEKMLKHFKVFAWIFEAIVMAIVGYLYLKEGKQLIQYVCFGAAFMFIVAAIVYIIKQRSSRHTNTVS
jgi:hypothetical protein